MASTRCRTRRGILKQRETKRMHAFVSHSLGRPAPPYQAIPTRRASRIEAGGNRESSSTARLSAAQSRRLAYVRRLSNKGVVFVLAQPWDGHLADKYQVMKQGKIDQRQNLCAGKMRLVIAVVHVPENILLHLCKS